MQKEKHGHDSVWCDVPKNTSIGLTAHEVRGLPEWDFEQPKALRESAGQPPELMELPTWSWLRISVMVSSPGALLQWFKCGQG